MFLQTLSIIYFSIFQPLARTEDTRDQVFGKIFAILKYLHIGLKYFFFIVVVFYCYLARTVLELINIFFQYLLISPSSCNRS